MNRQFSSGIVVYVPSAQGREYLLLHYSSGHWDFPKGKMEKGESKIQAAERELKEETGLEATIDKGFEENLSYFFKGKEGNLINKTVFFFVGKAHGKEVVLSDEHIGFQWLPFGDAIQQLTFKNAREVLSHADEFLKHEQRI